MSLYYICYLICRSNDEERLQEAGYCAQGTLQTEERVSNRTFEFAAEVVFCFFFILRCVRKAFMFAFNIFEAKCLSSEYFMTEREPSICDLSLARVAIYQKRLGTQPIMK